MTYLPQAEICVMQATNSSYIYNAGISCCVSAGRRDELFDQSAKKCSLNKKKNPFISSRQGWPAHQHSLARQLFQTTLWLWQHLSARLHRRNTSPRDYFVRRHFPERQLSEIILRLWQGLWLHLRHWHTSSRG